MFLLFLVLIPSLLICNKLSYEWSAFFVAQVLPFKLLKKSQKSWSTWVQKFRRFEIMSVRNNILEPSGLFLNSKLQAAQEVKTSICLSVCLFDYNLIFLASICKLKSENGYQKLQSPNCNLESTKQNLQTDFCKLQSQNRNLQLSICKLQMAICKLQYANCNLKTLNRQASIGKL